MMLMYNNGSVVDGLSSLLSSGVERILGKNEVLGSNPREGSVSLFATMINKPGYSSGQRGQSVKLLAPPS